jgi:hypothetical protein
MTCIGVIRGRNILFKISPMAYLKRGICPLFIIRKGICPLCTYAGHTYDFETKDTFEIIHLVLISSFEQFHSIFF